MGTLYEDRYKFLLSYLTQFFLEWKMFEIKVVQKLETRYFQKRFFKKSYRLWDNVEKIL
jgi:uncharacterized membrane protein YcfT